MSDATRRIADQLSCCFCSYLVPHPPIIDIMSSFFDDPDSDHETEQSYPRPGQARASSSRARSPTTTNSIAPTSPSHSRAFSLIPGTEDDGASRGIGSEMGDMEDEAEDEGNDVKRLGRIWVKERGTGDIMPWEGDLMDTLFDKLEQQVCLPRGLEQKRS